MKNELNEALLVKLLDARDAQEVAELLRANGEDCTGEEASQIWQDIERYKADINQAGKEEAVFMQEVSSDEMEGAAGGQDGDFRPIDVDIRGGKGFPNCKATVESGSWCGTNDACTVWHVRYQGMDDCNQAWK